MLHERAPGDLGGQIRFRTERCSVQSGILAGVSRKPFRGQRLLAPCPRRSDGYPSSAGLCAGPRARLDANAVAERAADSRPAAALAVVKNIPSGHRTLLSTNRLRNELDDQRQPRLPATFRSPPGPSGCRTSREWIPRHNLQGDVNGIYLFRGISAENDFEILCFSRRVRRARLTYRSLI
jgi:hypothetical protein